MGTNTQATRPLTAQELKGDELSARLYAEQGYLVLNAPEIYRVGDIVTGAGVLNESMQTPLRIVGFSSKEEYLEQEHLADTLTGNAGPWRGRVHANFYLVEAAD